ncbi:MAG: hypothetical protein MJ233_04095 [Mycoplasmoidaceae bacterium]|nr:hypothetical protein [Mycoplasmoidaceae bacterium]
MVIPNTVDYVDGNAFYIYDDETETAHSTIPSNITSLSFEERKDNAERPFLGLAESCFCEAPFVKISLPKHFGGSYSAYNMSDVERTDGAFKGCPNVTTLDLTAFDDETAYRCLNGIDYNTFAN